MDQHSIITSDLNAWERALRLFERTSGLVISLYHPDGTRLLGPYTTTPLGELLVNTGIFEPSHVAQRWETQEFLNNHGSAEVHDLKFADALNVARVPIIADEKVQAVIVYGWVFDHFTDPVECDKLGAITGVPGLTFWQTARTQSPISREMLTVFEEMLRLLVSTMTEQMLAVNELKVSSRLKDEVLALVSHELKTPLTSLLLRVQMLKAHKVPEEKFERFVSSLESNTLLQSQLVDDLLDAAKVTANKLKLETEVIDLQVLIESTLDLLRLPASEKSISLNYRHYGGDFRIEADSRRLRQCLTKLIANAIKFTPKGGRVDLCIERESQTYHLKIEDTGRGISSDRLAKIFDRFAPENINQSSSGFGLGLFIVKRIIDLHGGSITVFSGGRGKGTRIDITLPFAANRAVESH